MSNRESDGAEHTAHTSRGVQITLYHDGEGEEPIILEDVASATWSQNGVDDVIQIEFVDGTTDTYWAKHMVIGKVVTGVTPE